MPVLWALSVKFIGIGIIMLQLLFPFKPAAYGLDGTTVGDTWMTYILAYLANPWVWGILFGVAVLIIAILSMIVAYTTKTKSSSKKK